jgi:hypothetical protein
LKKAAQVIARRRFAVSAKLRPRAGSALDAHGDAHAAADAQRGQALLGVAALHLVQQRDEDAAPEAPIGWPMAMAPPLTLTLADPSPDPC